MQTESTTYNRYRSPLNHTQSEIFTRPGIVSHERPSLEIPRLNLSTLDSLIPKREITKLEADNFHSFLISQNSDQWVFSKKSISQDFAKEAKKYIENSPNFIKSIFFEDCLITPFSFALICDALIVSDSLETLSIKGSLCSEKITQEIARIINEKIRSLKILQFFEVKFTQKSLMNILKATAEQNANSKGIETLLLESCGLSEQHTKALALIGQSNHLTTVSLWGNKIGSGKVLTSVPSPTAKRFSMPHIKSSSSAIQIMCDSLKSNQSVKVLSLGSNKLGQQDLETLGFLTLTNSHITVLVGGNPSEPEENDRLLHDTSAPLYKKPSVKTDMPPKLQRRHTISLIGKQTIFQG